MADVPITYSYPSGTPFDVSAHNRQIKDIQAALNSNVTVANTASTFSVNESMIMREQATLGRQEWSLDSTTYMADGIGSSTGSDIEDAVAWRTVAGSGIRWYQPYDVSAAMLQWSFFCSTNTWQIRNHQTNRTESTSLRFNYDTVFTAFYDGLELAGQRRAPPRSCVYPASKWSKSYGDGLLPPRKRWVQVEAHNALQWDHHRLLEINPVGGPAISKGWHELYIAVRMERPLRGRGVFKNVHTPFGGIARKHTLIMNNKASFGIRNARVVTFL